MSESNQPVTLHITRREQISLGLALMKIELKGKDERSKKVAAFSEFGLTWVKEIAEDPTENNLPLAELARIFDAATEAGVAKVDAFRSVADRVLQLRDPFAGKRTTEAAQVTVSRASSSWVLDKLEGATVGGVDDFAIAELEDRIASARRGDYKLPDGLTAVTEAKAA